METIPINPDTKYVLSLHGGGIRGVLSAQILARLEEDLKKPLNEIFDMCGGTSSGSITIASALYANMTCKDIVTDIFSGKSARKLMKKSCIDAVLGILQLKPKYTSTCMSEIINSVLSDPDMLVSDCETDTLIFAFNMNDYKPRVYKSFINDGSKIKDAVMSSSAAPIYFPAHKDSVSGKYNIDGGCYANDPTDCVYAEAIKRFGKTADIKVLSIGTGYFKRSDLKMKGYGGLNWLLCGNLISLLFTAPAIAVDYKMEIFAESLGHGYLQLNCDVCDIDMDDTSDETIKLLVEIGNNLYEANKDKLMDFFK